MYKVFVTLTIFFFLLPCVFALAGENLLQNGDFEKEEQGFIEMWYTDAYNKGDDAVRFFLSDQFKYSGTKSLGIANKQENDAKVIQWVRVKPDTYYKISGWVKTVDVTGGKIGANISVIGTTKLAHHYLDTGTDWKPIEFYGLTGREQINLGIVLRLGYYGSLVTGYAFFDDLSLSEEPLPAMESVLNFSTNLYEPVSPRTTGPDTGTSPGQTAKLWQLTGNGQLSLLNLSLILGCCLIIVLLLILLIITMNKARRYKNIFLEKRHTGRRKKKLDVIAIKTKRSGSLEESFVKSRDISVDGIFIVTEDLNLYQIDDNLELRISLDKKELISARARVIRSEITRKKKTGLTIYGYGLQFTGIEKKHQQKLIAFVYAGSSKKKSMATPRPFSGRQLQLKFVNGFKKIFTTIFKPRQQRSASAEKPAIEKNKPVAKSD